MYVRGNLTGKLRGIKNSDLLMRIWTHFTDKIMLQIECHGVENRSRPNDSR